MPRFPKGAHIKGGRASAEVHRANARAFYGPLSPMLLELRAQGLSLRAIAQELDRLGIKTRYGAGAWTAMQVKRVLSRLQRDPDSTSAD